jgi:2-methylcitrate dehydratase PrpD
MKINENYTETVARFVADLTSDRIPDEVVAAAKTAILDCLGVALAGSREECVRICAEQIRLEQARGEASVWGQGFTSSASSAALVNGTATHALDFDHGVYLGQPTSALIPAVLSLAETIHASGRDLLEAYVAAFEATAKIAKSIPEEGRGGWHSAGTLGTLGATLSCAKLLKLEADAIRTALGIATSMASGASCNYGTMTKPLGSGLAARNGVLAAGLAQKGFTASRHALESATGFFDAYLSLPPDPAPITEELGRSYELAHGLKIKPYPCGGLSHNAIDAVLDMREHDGLRADQVESIEVELAKHAYERLVFQIPRTGLEGKFCMGYLLGRAMINGKVSLDDFTDAAVREPPMVDFAKRVHITLNSALTDSSEIRPSNVEIRLKDGRTLSRYVEYSKGGPQAPLSLQELQAKFSDCAKRVIDSGPMGAVVEYVGKLDSLEDVRPLCRLLLVGTER